MPDCRNCPQFGQEYCSVESLPTIDWMFWSEKDKRWACTTCSTAVIKKYVPMMSGQILEIGHGVSKILRRHLRKFHRGKAIWWGTDAKFPDHPEARKYGASVHDMPMFKDEQFDWVVGLQTIEHWHEKGSTIEDGLKEIHRVLRSGGKLLLSLPFLVHGAPMFWHGRWQEALKYFETGWSEVMTERWRWDYRPLPALENWRIARELVDKMYYEADEPEGSGQPGGPSSWTMEVLATK